ncbi:MAG: ATP-binding cassette domain-containing protein, partial [Vulcanibacillus sp.]
DSYMTVEEVIKQPLDIIKEGNSLFRKDKVKEALGFVQLESSEEFLTKKCYSLSGGQRQRIAIARSLVMNPKILIADEISTMLDPSTKANILRLLKGLQNSIGFSMLYITHDISLARKIADKIYVMHEGKIIEESSALDFFENPHMDYSKLLINEGLNIKV